MKVFLSVDMEGTTGLESLEEIFVASRGCDIFRQLMAGDALNQSDLGGSITKAELPNPTGRAFRGAKIGGATLRRLRCRAAAFGENMVL